MVGVTKSHLSLGAFGLTLGSVLLYAAGSVWRILAWMSAVSVLSLGLMTAVSGPLYPDPALLQAHHWVALVFAVVVFTTFGQAVLFNLYRRYPVSEVAPWILLTPLFAGLFSILIYDESISTSLFLGGVVVLSGVWFQQSG